MTAPVSAVVITRDEEDTIERCLNSLRWLAEVIVVDADSRDRTVELAERFGARVFQRTWPGYARQKNFGIEQATQPWILCVDADEEVPPELAEEIQETVTRSPAEAAFRLYRPTFFMGFALRHYGREREDPGQLRLFRNGHGRFDDRLVHERVRTDGRVGLLRSPLLHHSYPTVGTYWRKIHRYAHLEAQQRAATGTNCGGHRWARALGKLGWMLIWRRGALDGPRAWLWIAGQGYQEWLATGEAVRQRRREEARA
jgi:(heptosyl)LPS beta-1,4-glucosyltransferase